MKNFLSVLLLTIAMIVVLAILTNLYGMDRIDDFIEYIKYDFWHFFCSSILYFLIALFYLVLIYSLIFKKPENKNKSWGILFSVITLAIFIIMASLSIYLWSLVPVLWSVSVNYVLEFFSQIIILYFIYKIFGLDKK